MSGKRGEEITGVAVEPSSLRVVISIERSAYALVVGQGEQQIAARDISYMLPQHARVASIRVGDIEVADFEVIDNAHLRFRAPAHVPGWVPVSLVDTSGRVWPVASSFTYAGGGGALPEIITNPETGDGILLWVIVALAGVGVTLVGYRQVARRQSAR